MRDANVRQWIDEIPAWCGPLRYRALGLDERLIAIKTGRWAGAMALCCLDAPDDQGGQVAQVYTRTDWEAGRGPSLLMTEYGVLIELHPGALPGAAEILYNDVEVGT